MPSEASRKPEHLPPGLTGTVGVVEEILGRVVAAAEGEGLYEVVECVRRDMVAFREAASDSDRESALDRAAERLAALSIEEKTALARAYTLYLQLVNVCENAYRTHRLRQRSDRLEGTGSSVWQRSDRERQPGPPAPTAELTFVLTAHPTESRSPENIRLFRRLQDHLIDSLDRSLQIERSPAGREIENLLHLAWRVGTHPREKPSVADEANHLVSLLTDPILAELVALTEAGHRVLLRTWVGGDKDGHPGVGPNETQTALQLARGRLLAFVDAVLLRPVRDDVALLGHAPVAEAFTALDHALSDLRTVRERDGARVEVVASAAAEFQSVYGQYLGVEHPAVRRLELLLSIFPALVVPLELREERGRFAADSAIADMMGRLARLAEGGRIHAYARAVVVSMTTEAEDLLEAQALADERLGEAAIPVIPLFELPDVLERASQILEAAWGEERFRAAVWRRGALEVMLGYSDTAKRMGMLASRVALHDAMQRIGEWAGSRDVAPIFFHGHGGSVGRGGGRIEDLAATWPPGARVPYKYTLQGEMVERTLATPEILRRLVEKVAHVQARSPSYCGVGTLARDLARAAEESFAERVASGPFRELLERATPYGRLQALTIGSRPARRGGGGLEELRAIPWVLCWTQTRLLLHAWLGVGEAWQRYRETRALGAAEMRDVLASATEEDLLFRSYTRLLSFTLAKTAPAIWRRYQRQLAGAGRHDATRRDLSDQLDRDYEAALDLAYRAVDADTLLPERPWLEESIAYRAPMVHPLNLLQIELLAEPEWSERQVELFRETVTGIAAGMLTTG